MLEAELSVHQSMHKLQIISFLKLLQHDALGFKIGNLCFVLKDVVPSLKKYLTEIYDVHVSRTYKIRSVAKP